MSNKGITRLAAVALLAGSLTACVGSGQGMGGRNANADGLSLFGGQSAGAGGGRPASGMFATQHQVSPETVETFKSDLIRIGHTEAEAEAAIGAASKAIHLFETGSSRTNRNASVTDVCGSYSGASADWAVGKGAGVIVVCSTGFSGSAELHVGKKEGKRYRVGQLGTVSQHSVRGGTRTMIGLGGLKTESSFYWDYKPGK
ncbi:hypothetical protein [Azospirillum sp. TSO5]|uniref:hypothetical protein n=1 Tax=Azospirillum sp. TSO5 TaxID=716760 RepID=UPI000D616A01|nr:hypothetical protein [Azospirillum sp. TSO5]PWC92973.1 hypothetical protein TSO5_16230 [Azospirillum sp. TSO5]